MLSLPTLTLALTVSLMVYEHSSATNDGQSSKEQRGNTDKQSQFNGQLSRQLTQFARKLDLRPQSEVTGTLQGRSHPKAELKGCNINIRTFSAYDGCDQRSLPGFVELNGRRVWTAGWCIESIPLLRGVNTMIINPTDCSAHDIRTFDTWDIPSAASDLVEYLGQLRPGALIVGVTADEPSRLLDPAKSRLRALGVYVDDVENRGSFAFVVQTGFPEKTHYVKSLNNDLLNIHLRVQVTGHSIEDLRLKRVPSTND